MGNTVNWNSQQKNSKKKIKIIATQKNKFLLFLYFCNEIEIPKFFYSHPKTEIFL